MTAAPSLERSMKIGLMVILMPISTYYQINVLISSFVLAAAVKFISGIISPQSRTLISKLVPDDEIAKVFALIMVVEFIVSIGSSPFYTFIYNATVDTDPGFYNFVSAGLFGICIIIILIIMFLEYKTTLSYEELIIEEEQDTPETLAERI
uniref:Uncharacterized protein LOC114338699 n=1 Tax=Diabrotica virgifera virgifera TaxID=50390 RepID=A0A6P7G7J8_DIAVI